MDVQTSGKDVIRLGAETITPESDHGAPSVVQRRRVESWLAALLQGEHLSLLIGNGLSMAVGSEINTFPPSMSSALDAGNATDMIRAHAARAASDLGRKPNLEDEIRSALTLVQGYDVLGDDASRDALASKIDSAMRELLEGVLDFERSLLQGSRAGSSHAKSAETLLQRFLLPFTSRPPQRDRLHLYTTNYDRILEFAADLLGLRLLDRFVGTLQPSFSASRLDIDYHYSPPGVRGEPRLLDGVVRFGKLHGSVDWHSEYGTIVKSGLGFGADSDSPLLPAKPSETTVIYPNPAKDVETLAYPYSELFRDLAAAICRPNAVLFTYGYGFGDSHINRVVSDMLTIPSTHLVVVSRDPLSALDSFKATNMYPEAQTTELIGPAVGSLPSFVELTPSLVSVGFLEAQAEYAERGARLRSASGETGSDGARSVPGHGTPAATPPVTALDEPPF
jgi:catechol 2,3-dioxygenase-like lactoylglutathione lyase family enzyme